MLFLHCSKCGQRGRPCSWTVMRFKAWCDQCGHSSACHEARRLCPSCIILLAVAAMLITWLAIFGKMPESGTAVADLSSSRTPQTSVRQ